MNIIIVKIKYQNISMPISVKEVSLRDIKAWMASLIKVAGIPLLKENNYDKMSSFIELVTK